MHTPVIRPGQPADSESIRRVMQEAFRDMPFADGDEHELIDALRDVGALVVSLVADLDGRVIGHVAFSPTNAAVGSAGTRACTSGRAF